ncbi:MAG TPA: hypothetical protein VGS01_00695 [Candidatus Limnocylindria bacterium]|jgi:hypothetical protein|nr:hypothetical protein [Candidatus Limnocylindria bacterium]
MEVLIFIAGLVALDILANLVGPNGRDIEAALRREGGVMKDI